MNKNDIIYTINRSNFIVIVYNTFVSHLLLHNTIVVLYGLLILKTYSKLALGLRINLHNFYIHKISSIIEPDEV